MFGIDSCNSFAEKRNSCVFVAGGPKERRELENGKVLLLFTMSVFSSNVGSPYGFLK